MSILIIHLSDIHIKNENNHIFKKENRIFDAIHSEIDFEIDTIFCVIIGDIAFSGNAKEYEIAYDFFAKFEKEIKTKVNFVFCPGNHDCDFSDADSTRNLIIDSCCSSPDKKLLKDAIENCCKTQINFCDFKACLEESSTDKCTITENKLLQVKKYNVSNEYQIIFNCYNTAWCSTKTENKTQAGKKIFPIYYIEELIEDIDKSLIISIFHHPYNWLAPDNLREFRDFIEKTSDIILTGHEHSERNIKKSILETNKDNYLFQGAILQNSKDKNDSGFKTIKIDLQEKKGEIKSFIWNKDKRIYSGKSIPIDLKQIAKKKRNCLRKEFENQLQDIKISLSHKNVDEILLKDIFIYPYLKKISADSNIIDNEVRADKLLKFSKNSINKIILAGAEQSGKTALCNALFLKYYERDFVPIILHKINAKNITTTKIKRLVNKAYCEQYEGEFEDYEQLDKRNKIIIIDNLNFLKLPDQYEIVKICQRFYNHIVITTDDLFKFIHYNQQEDCPIDDFLQFEILKLGHLARSELIRRWISLGNCYDESELLEQEDKLTNFVNGIILKNIIPRYPIFILTILQTYETLSPSDYHRTSYGYCYMSLIIHSFRKIKIPPEDISALYMNYLTHLAFFLFDIDKIELSDADLYFFKKKYSEKYPVYYSQDEIIDNLIKSKIIHQSELGNFKFKYKYFYFFFVAKYLSEHIDESPIKEIISKLCKKIHVNKFANIIIFLTYHSNKSFILDEIILNMMMLYEKNKPATLNREEISFIGDFLNQIPQIILKNKDVLEERKKQLRLKDSAEKNSEAQEQKLDAQDYETQFKDKSKEKSDAISQMNQAFKSIEIIGQILKNHWGSIEIPKQKELISEAYEVGLKTLNYFLELSEELEKDIINMIKDWLKNNGMDNNKAKKKATHFFTTACYYASFGVINKIASAIGYDRLSPLLRDVCKEYNTPAVNLIDLSIEMQFKKNIPIERLKELKKQFSGNLFTERMLQEIVIRHLYMHRIKDRDKQKISAILEISMKGQRQIEFRKVQKIIA